MWREPNSEDHAIEAAWRRLNGAEEGRGDGTTESAAGRPAEDTDLVREHHELLGLLAYELEPRTPSPAVRQNVLATIAGTIDSEVAREKHRADETVLAAEERFAARRPALPSAATVRRPRYRLAGALAAALALCLVGLGYLAGQLGHQRDVIARLDQELEQRADDRRAVGGLLDQLADSERKLRMITRVARRAYPMQTVQPVSHGPRPNGIIFVCGNHQRWYLNVDGLEPPPAGREYRLWFLTDHGTVPGGLLHVEPGESSELEDQQMPPGTRGFSITLEPEGEAGQEPRGEMVLLGEDSVSL